jgi:dihydrodipicolinate synthase/N-acetylneuraminate lyase
MYPYPPKGLIVALVTPFDTAGAIDWKSFDKLVEKVLPFADALLVGEAEIGEGVSMDPGLRQQLLAGAMKAVSGKKPLFLCPTANTPEETLAAVSSLGKNAPPSAGKEPIFWVDLPLWYHSNRKLPQFYREWEQVTSFPILLYNYPRLINKLDRSLKRENIRTAVLKRISENEQVVGLIQAGDLDRTIHYQRAVRTRREFRFYDGDERRFLDGPSSSGVVSWGANLFPEEWKAIVGASLGLCEDPGRNLLVFKQSEKLRSLNGMLRGSPVRGLKKALHHLHILAGTRTLDLPGSVAVEDGPEIRDFLRENFSLQSPE